MNHKNKRHRTISRFQKKFKNIAAAAVAGAAILSGAMLPGIAAPVAHASADPSNADQPAVTQQVKDTHSSKTTEKANPSNHNDQKSKDSKSKDTSSSAKAPTKYEDVLDITATAYAPGAHDNDQWGDKTYLGTQIRPGVVAVDPDVIPLGSRLYIQYPNGHGEYAVAEDTGGAIKGNRIDIAKTSVDKAQDFGMKDVKVFVVEKGDA
ncbi:3D (Asp-Asp-Asp) domain-containing protein [Pelosinus propionicus DSM 13327]|uniref:3D (Asp-Asp-Asp) domain-containing protein n=2 Tax=Pelosinus TaxID=365348 RepID=A0A1I4MYW6_9FIRM|nr:3D domain-containing protein [Pelosinus propionicus]SFM08285.1 3D (Asp-Asp-Asp) domain-containing protein [Pelosinus propionicus DSM 13327]